MFIEELELEITREFTLNDRIYRNGMQELSMGVRTIENVFDNIACIDSLKLKGGEPLIAITQLEKIVNLIKLKGIRVSTITLITNGTVISERVCNVLNCLNAIAKDKFNFIISNNLCNTDLDLSTFLRKRVHNTAIFKEYFGAKEIIELLEKNDDLVDYNDKNSSVYLHNTICGAIAIDIYGNIVKPGLSIEEEDEEARKTGLNINSIPLKEAVSRFAENEEKKHNGEDVCLGKKLAKY